MLYLRYGLGYFHSTHESDPLSYMYKTCSNIILCMYINFVTGTVSVHTFRGSDQKLAVMAPVLLTGLTKITDQPDEVRACQIGSLCVKLCQAVLYVSITVCSFQDEKLHVLAYTGIGCLAK